MNEDGSAVLDLPSTGLAAKAVELAVRVGSAATASHSIRSLLFARLLAEHQGMRVGADYESGLLLYACVLYGIGFSAEAVGGNGSKWTVQTSRPSYSPTTACPPPR
ncbi:hypothetical protein FB471_0597 [Amycolatopsis cihanbeyliensis]|uniref:Uncharacterized protein n=2 Tax=Amycolatopsis cihanbeyliensis TaxID=1128664 RepID=A0A542DCZ9_AMYCI|nr:hypothetical protein FB471_0597 [Amycolatopsis cihanbeyliensis]